MNHIMFDVDGTLVESYAFDEACFLESVKEVTGLDVASNWEAYPHVTDRGILKTFIERQAPDYSIDELEKAVKPVFVSRIRQYLKENSAQEVDGAIQFINDLRKRDDVVLSIATGGWRETAKAKLESAGFDLAGIPLTSSSEHHSRIEIMKLAKSKVENGSEIPLTYFGDEEWDKRACSALGVNLVIVGNRVSFHQSIDDFTESSKALGYIYAR